MENPTKWIDEWCEIYPGDVRFNGNILRSKPKDCINKMKDFCKKHPEYTKDIIFKATHDYIKEQEAKGFEYTRQAHYFIDKRGVPSLLEAKCEDAVKGYVQQIVVSDEDYEPINDFI